MPCMTIRTTRDAAIPDRKAKPEGRGIGGLAVEDGSAGVLVHG